MVSVTSQETLEKDKYLFPYVKRWFKEDPLVIVEGKGTFLKDIERRQYIDLFGMHS